MTNPAPRQGPKPENETIVERIDEKTIFVRPAWAIDLENPTEQAKPRRRIWKGSRVLSAMVFEMKVLVIVVVTGIVGVVLARGFYFAKSEAGIDLVPEVHGPDVAPVLK